MTVFAFNIFYELNDAPQTRYVVADSSDEAWTKIVSSFEKQRNEGLMFPQLITELGVEIDEVII